MIHPNALPVWALLFAVSQLLGGCALLKPPSPYAKLSESTLTVGAVPQWNLAGLPLRELSSYEQLRFEQATRLIKATYRDSVVVHLGFDVDIQAASGVSTMPAWHWMLDVDGRRIREGRFLERPVNGSLRYPFDIRINLSQTMAGRHPRMLYETGFRYSPLHPQAHQLELQITPLLKNDAHAEERTQDTIRISLMDSVRSMRAAVQP